MAGQVFLIGGGWTDAAIPETWRRFVDTVNGGSIACVLLDDEDTAARDEYAQRYVSVLEKAGAKEVVLISVTPEQPLRPERLDTMAGIVIGGGLTPDYQKAIVTSSGEAIRAIVAKGIPYAGFSAGSAIAAAQGIVGGWKLPADKAGYELPICAEDVSEDEELLAVRPGIGLVPFAVDVHASQWGTIARLIHAVRTGAVAEGWAIDEDTMLEVSGGEVIVRGLGSAYHVTRGDNGLHVLVKTATS